MKINEVYLGGLLFFVFGMAGVAGVFTGTGFATNVGRSGSGLFAAFLLMISLALLNNYFHFIPKRL